MSDDKTEEPLDSHRRHDSEGESQKEESKLNGGYFTEDGEYVPLSDDNSPPYKIGHVEGDGYYGDGFHVSEDGKDLTIFYEMGRAGDENDDPIRGARKMKSVDDDKTEEPLDSQNPLDASPLKEQTESLQETSNKDGSPDENPEVLTTIDITELDPSNFNWLRQAKKVREANKRAPRDVDENTDR